MDWILLANLCLGVRLWEHTDEFYKNGMDLAMLNNCKLRKEYSYNVK
jgi:hypothetical protein